MQLMFNAQQYEPKWGGGSSLPVSDANGHACVFVASEPKPTKDDPQAWYLELTAQIIEGPNTGMQGPVRLNIGSKSAQALDIAHKQLSAICHAVGVYNLQDTTVLHNKPLRLIVANQPKKTNDPNEPIYTQVTGVRDMQGNEPGKAPKAQAQPGAQINAAAGYQTQGNAQPGYVAPQPPAAPQPPQGQWSAPATNVPIPPQNNGAAPPAPPWQR